MVISLVAVVSRADFTAMTTHYQCHSPIDARLEVDGLHYAGARLALRCTPALNYPKKDFELQFADDQRFQGRYRRLWLDAVYPDQSLIRTRLALTLAEKTALPVPAHWHAHLTIRAENGETLFSGLYTALQPLEDMLLARTGRRRGTVFHADGRTIDGEFVGADLRLPAAHRLERIYTLRQPATPPPTGWPARLAARFRPPESPRQNLLAFIKALDVHSPPANDAAALGRLVDLDAIIDFLAINALVQNNHVFDRNYTLFQRHSDRRWLVSTTDFLFTFGRSWVGRNGALDKHRLEQTPIKGAWPMRNQLSRRLLSNPATFARFRERVLALLHTAFTEAALFPKIDALFDEITPLAQTDRLKWPTNDEFARERDRLKAWVKHRRRFLYADLGRPVVAAGSQTSPQADSQVIGLTLSNPTPVAGEEIIFEATVQNTGQASTQKTVGVAFLIDGQTITFGTTGPMPPAETRTVRAVSAWRATPGGHSLLAIVDDVNRYPEASETNNQREIRFWVEARPAGPPLADARVQDIAFERLPDGRARLAALVQNAGQAPTTDLVGVAFFVNGRYATFGTIPPLAAGQSQAVRANAPLSLAGSHPVTAIVDDVNRFAESDEANNTLTKSINFGTPPGGQADVVILNAGLGAGRLAEGDGVFFEATVKNQGAASTGNVVGVAFLVDGRSVTFGTTAAMPPGAVQTLRAVSAWTATAGRHHLLAVVDDVNRFPELSEENNRFLLDFEVQPRHTLNLPDSTVEAIGVEAHPDGQVTLTATVSNIGTVPTPDVVGVAFFVNDRYVTYGLTPPMLPGATATVRAIKPLTLYGKQKLTAIVDDVDRYGEISHRNNALTRTVTINTTERRALWVTRYDWTDFQQVARPETIDHMVETIARAGFNTIFFQVRAAGDAYYTPGLEPWAARLTGSQSDNLGHAPGWDPLARMIEKATAAGLEVHAYLNVYTAWLPPSGDEFGQIVPPPTEPPALFDRLTYKPAGDPHPGQYGLGDTWRQYSGGDSPMPLAWGRYLWASPGVDAVRDHIVAVAQDVVTRYAVHGLHLDRVRYAGKGYSFDPASNAVAGVESTPIRNQWQRDRITDLLNRVNTAIKAIRPGVWLSAAVWPVYQNKWGWDTDAGYSDYYQDSKGWLSAGVVDAIAPMLYNGLADDFDKWQILMHDFVADAKGRHVYPGIGGDYPDFADIARRIEACREAGAPGHVLFSYSALVEHDHWARLATGPYAVPVPPPPVLPGRA